MGSSDYTLTRHSTYGFLHLDPIPADTELERFYNAEYYRLIRQGGRAPDLARIKQGGDAAERERMWLKATLYDDIADYLARYKQPGVVIDVGCGLGDLVDDLLTRGHEAEGIEPSSEAVRVAQARGLPVYCGGVADLARVSRAGGRRIAAITMLYVLEHLPDPCCALEVARETLSDGGILIVQVPNDYSVLQEAARRKLGTSEWWLAVPDHINYFNFETLATTLHGCGFTVIDKTTDFPMELFLLMGDDYVTNLRLGAACHEKRVSFELALPRETRRQLYHALAAAGFGRSAIVLARKTK